MLAHTRHAGILLTVPDTGSGVRYQWPHSWRCSRSLFVREKEAQVLYPAVTFMPWRLRFLKLLVCEDAPPLLDGIAMSRPNPDAHAGCRRVLLSPSPLYSPAYAKPPEEGMYIKRFLFSFFSHRFVHGHGVLKIAEIVSSAFFRNPNFT
jgi:hypothetical protein